MPFQDVPYSIIRKSVVFINYFCYFAALTIYFYKNQNIYGFVFVYCLFNLVWMSVQFPTILLS